ncbi:MAG: SMC-Scp complex subunit ScpB [Anaplasmataceae bacterium]|nr:SMC-Scp complex subunit ScpB [Anaplasmataceae bacterium]
MEEHIAKLEALLFLHGEPISFKKIEELLNLKTGQGELCVHELQEKRQAFNGGLVVMVHDGRVQLVTKKEFHDLAEKFIKEELDSDLTPASLETLSLILYFGPISRSRIEYIRGVNSIFTLRNLMVRGLIERRPDPNHSNSFLYQASFASLRHLGLNRESDLPQYQKFRTLLDQSGVEESPSNS